MFKKLFALCAVTVLLAACEYRNPKSEGPMSGGKRTFNIYFDTGSAKLSSASADTINKLAEKTAQTPSCLLGTGSSTAIINATNSLADAILSIGDVIYCN